MAEFSPPTQTHSKNKTRLRSTRVDLTPMVDLGFLLITFFIFTTSMTAPKSLRLAMPDDRNVKDSTELPRNATLQIVLEANDQVWYYHGDQVANVEKTFYGTKLREIIIDKKRAVSKVFGNENELTLVIKPTKGSSLKNIVDIMDEVLINDIKHYIITEPNAADLESIRKN